MSFDPPASPVHGDAPADPLLHRSEPTNRLLRSFLHDATVVPISPGRTGIQRDEAARRHVSEVVGDGTATFVVCHALMDATFDVRPIEETLDLVARTIGGKRIILGLEGICATSRRMNLDALRRLKRNYATPVFEPSRTLARLLGVTQPRSDLLKLRNAVIVVREGAIVDCWKAGDREPDESFDGARQTLLDLKPKPKCKP